MIWREREKRREKIYVFNFLFSVCNFLFCFVFFVVCFSVWVCFLFFCFCILLWLGGSFLFWMFIFLVFLKFEIVFLIFLVLSISVLVGNFLLLIVLSFDIFLDFFFKIWKIFDSCLMVKILFLIVCFLNLIDFGFWFLMFEVEGKGGDIGLGEEVDDFLWSFFLE